MKIAQPQRRQPTAPARAPGKDAADALGLAITHARAGSTMSKLVAAGAVRRTSAMYKGGRSY